MQLRRCRQSLVVLVVLLPGVLVSRATSVAADAERLAVHAKPAVSPEPGWVDLRISRDPHVMDRELIVEIDSQNFFRSSLVSLEGDDGPSVVRLHFRHLPAGAYLVRVHLGRGEGAPDREVTTAFRVVGAPEELPPPRR